MVCWVLTCCVSGAKVGLDFLTGYINSSNVDVVGVLDSPLWLDIAPYPKCDFVGFNYTTSHVYHLANATG